MVLLPVSTLRRFRRPLLLPSSSFGQSSAPSHFSTNWTSKPASHASLSLSPSLPLSLFLSRAVHKSHMSSDATSSQRATALKSLAQGGQPAAPAMWCTATPSQQSTSPAAESIIPHPWILHPPPQCLHIHDPWPFISDPLPCKILGLPELDGTVRNTVPDCMAALLSYWWLFPHGVSSRPVWPGLSTDL